MGDQVKVLIDGNSLPVEPVGSLAANGWFPGTWVKYTNNPITFSRAMATVDISNGEGVIAGFLKTGPQHNQPVLMLSDMWKDDLTREGGDSQKDWTSFDAGSSCYFDKQTLLQRQGSRIVTMNIIATGVWQFYVYEKFDLAERTNVGTGAALSYVPNDPLYISNRGYLTKEQESVGHPFIEFVVVRAGTDRDGDYLIVAGGKGG
jgi:hypothetical protein